MIKPASTELLVDSISISSAPALTLLSRLTMLYSCGRRALQLAVWGLSSIVFVQSVITPFMAQSFFFDWNPAGQAYPIPVTVQCGNIHIVWGRGTATGPNPVGPYYLQVYTSIYQVPIIIPVGDVLIYDWAVPFPPGTLYQICMFDKYGNTGGCQATYTVIANTTGTPSCANVTLPHTLSIDAQVDNGPISQYGWVDQCTDISITPKNGTPPYTVTIAPSLHPPSNITIAQVNISLNWTVNLSWSSPFFLSVVDSAGNMWANGLLHSGQGKTSSCLAGNATMNASGLKPVVVIGSGIGGLALGLFVGILLTALIVKKKYKKGDNPVYLAASPPASPPFSSFGPATTPGLTSNYTPVPSSPFGVLHNSMGSSNQSSFGQSVSQLGRSSPYAADPFTTGEHGRLNPEPASFRRPLSSSGAYAGGPAAPQNQVYVVHNDSQSPPVTIYHEDGAQIVELPPRYAAGASTSRGDGADALSDVRSFNDGGSDGGRTATTDATTLLQEQSRAYYMTKRPANGIYSGGPNR